jgi:hypothetical protein
LRGIVPFLIDQSDEEIAKKIDTSASWVNRVRKELKNESKI